MKTNNINRFLTCTLSGVLLLTSVTFAEEGVGELTAKGKELEARYSGMLQALNKQIDAALPQISEEEKTALIDAFHSEEELENKVRSAWQKVWELEAKEDELELLRLMKKHGPDTIKGSEARIRWAKSLPDDDPTKAQRIKTAEGKLPKRAKEVEELPKKIEKAERELAQVNERLPKAMEEYEATADALDEKQARSRKMVDDLGIESILNGSLDTQLAQAMILHQATPRKLAEYAQQGAEEEQRIEQILADTPMMVRILEADGARGGEIGPAIEIYNAIQKASDRAKEGVLERLALAIAIEHATPWGRDRPEAETGGPEHIDPVELYLSFEQAYLNGELDPSFENQSVWNFRMVVGDKVTPEMYAWGRMMIKNLRPDLTKISLSDARYERIVEKEIRYSSEDVDKDRPELYNVQNILDNGGICGRHAHFGRYILRAHGVPSTNRPQKGHAALVHYAPDNWQPQQGAHWGGNVYHKNMFGAHLSDHDFLTTTRARRNPEAYLRVERAHWMGTLKKEPVALSRIKDKGSVGRWRLEGEAREKTGFWHAVALVERQEIVDGMDLEPLPRKRPYWVGTEPEFTREDKTITTDNNGVITIPVAATTEPPHNTKMLYKGKLRDGLTFMESELGGVQVHISKFGNAGANLHYTFNVPRAGKYALTAKVVTPGHELPLNVDVNDLGVVQMSLPYTAGKWETTEPLVVDLKKGTNTIYLSGPTRASFKHFQLTPVN